jgi:hypothetical protein
VVEELLDAVVVAGPSWCAAVVVQLTRGLPLRRNIKFNFYSCCGTGLEVVGLFYVREEINLQNIVLYHKNKRLFFSVFFSFIFFMAGVSPNIKENKIFVWIRKNPFQNCRAD